MIVHFVQRAPGLDPLSPLQPNPTGVMRFRIGVAQYAAVDAKAFFSLGKGFLAFGVTILDLEDRRQLLKDLRNDLIVGTVQRCPTELQSLSQVLLRLARQ